jgi:hypothetical protein
MGIAPWAVEEGDAEIVIAEPFLKSRTLKEA